MLENKPSYIIKPNPDAETFKEVSEAVKDNDNYCCCELVKTEDTKCMIWTKVGFVIAEDFIK